MKRGSSRCHSCSGANSPSHACTPASKCGSLQCGQPNLEGSETRCIQVESGVDCVAGLGTYKSQHGHSHTLAPKLTFQCGEASLPILFLGRLVRAVPELQLVNPRPLDSRGFFCCHAAILTRRCDETIAVRTDKLPRGSPRTVRKRAADHRRANSPQKQTK